MVKRVSTLICPRTWRSCLSFLSNYYFILLSALEVYIWTLGHWVWHVIYIDDVNSVFFPPRKWKKNEQTKKNSTNRVDVVIQTSAWHRPLYHIQFIFHNNLPVVFRTDNSFSCSCSCKSNRGIVLAPPQCTCSASTWFWPADGVCFISTDSESLSSCPFQNQGMCACSSILRLIL